MSRKRGVGDEYRSRKEREGNGRNGGIYHPNGESCNKKSAGQTTRQSHEQLRTARKREGGMDSVGASGDPPATSESKGV